MSIFKLLSIIAISSTLSGTVVLAQKTNTKARPQSRPTASASPEKSRARRTVPPSTQPAVARTDPAKAEPRTNEATPQSSPASAATPIEAQPGQPSSPAKTKALESTPQEQPTAETDAQPAATESDPIVELREQIEVATNPQDRIRLQLQLADLLASNGKKSEAITELHSVTATDVFDPPGFYNTGNALARLGDTEGAVNAYRKAVEQRKGRYSRALNNLGVILLRVGRWDEAYDALASALKVENFRYAEASYNLGRLYAARGQMDLATREWRRAIQVNPEHTAATQLLARAGDDGRITVAQPRAVSREAKSRAASGAVASEMPEKPSARRLTLDPTSFSFLQKARSAADKGNRLEAVDNYKRLIASQNGYFAPANLELAFVLVGLNRDQEALTALLEVINRDGSHYPIGYYHIGRIYERQGELKLAEEAFLRAIAAYGNQNGQFMLDLSRVREKQGNFPGAAEAMEHFIAAMKKEGQDLTWSEERLNSLRQKTSAPK